MWTAGIPGLIQSSRLHMNPESQKMRKNGDVSSAAIGSLLALLIFPALAVLRLARNIDPRLLLSYVIVISGATFLLYRQDKKRAQSGERRTPESTLHFAELLGGWPGAFIAQRTLRHKISKTSYQVKFWAIIILHELVSFDYTQNWEYLKRGLSLL